MNNLTQIQKDAKQAYLTRQAEDVLAIYQTADNSNSKIIIKRISLNCGSVLILWCYNVQCFENDPT